MELVTLNPYQKLRLKARKDFKEGVKPVDGRQPIPDELAISMIQELDVPKDSLIGVYDAFLILTSHLREQGYTNIVVLENTHKNLTQSQEKYYDSIKTVCNNSSGIKYYTPPMNNYNRCDMKFDVIIGNPPYQNTKDHGSIKGSGKSPLWFQITKISLNLLKENGILSFITPDTIVNGSDELTSAYIGPSRKFDLKYLDFDVNNSFKVGIKICRTIIINSFTPGNICEVSDGRMIDTDVIYKVTNDQMFDDILNTLLEYDGPKINFNTKNQYHMMQIEKDLKNKGLPAEWARESKSEPDDVYNVAVNVNGKFKYTRVPGKNAGTWRLFIPRMTNPTVVSISKDWEADGSTFTMVFDTEEDALRTQSYLNDPLYLWVLESTKVSGRINTSTITRLPNAPIEEVLTDDQISYIRSQL